MNQERDRAENGNGEVETLVRLAGERPQVPRARADRVRAVAREAWRAEVRRRSVVRVAWIGSAAAAAAALALAVAFGVLPRSGPPAEPGILVSVESIHGVANAIPSTAGRPLASGDRLPRGAEIRTDASGRIALLLASGSSVRLDASSSLRLLGPEEIALEEGAVYVDSGAEAGPESALVVRTPLGDVRETGTQFEVRLAEGSLRVRLREGAVSVRRGTETHAVRGGDELHWEADGTATRRDIAPYGREWEWTSGIAPMIDLEGRTVREFLEWATREQGLILEYADPAVERAAGRVVLAGTPARLTPEEALEAVLPACRMTHRIDGGILRVGSESEPGGPVVP